MSNELDRDTLSPTEPHPSAYEALDYVRQHLTTDMTEAFASCAIESNRLGEICSGTIRRLKKGEPVSDRYILGLAWAVKCFVEDQEKPKTTKAKKSGTKKPSTKKSTRKT